MARELRLLVLASKPAGMSPSQRYRFEQWAPHLAREGIQLEFAPFESAALAQLLYAEGRVAAKALLTARDFMRRSAILKRVRSYDAVVVHREAALIGPPLYETLIARSGVPIIYDFDDAIWSPAQAWKNGLFSRLHFPAKTSAICKIAAAVTVGNAFLADYARQRNQSVSVIPSSIELADYARLAEAQDDQGRFVVCWTGSTSTLVHFEHAREALERLAAEIPLAVKVICSSPPQRPIAGADTRFVKWSAEREAAEVGDCHVGIMPLPDDEVSRGKGGMKALQLMATGRPVVVSPIGANREIVRDGENGFLAGSTDEFVAALVKLATSATLRRVMGDEARKTVERSYTAEASAVKFASVLRSVVRET